jgi:hypothetical protein
VILRSLDGGFDEKAPGRLCLDCGCTFLELGLRLWWHVLEYRAWDKEYLVEHQLQHSLVHGGVLARAGESLRPGGPDLLEEVLLASLESEFHVSYCFDHYLNLSYLLDSGVYAME